MLGTRKELADALREEWQAMPQGFLRNLILSMPSREEVVRRASTKLWTGAIVNLAYLVFKIIFENSVYF